MTTLLVYLTLGILFFIICLVTQRDSMNQANFSVVWVIPFWPIVLYFLSIAWSKIFIRKMGWS